tara:strand:+ start:191 stop:493 length:303 start_codon:yes stop_codon:yes gene_type:complete
MKWTPVDKRRRWFGLLYLILAIGMLVWGQTLLKPHLRGLSYLVYWLVCFGLTTLALLTAVLDLWVVRLRQRRSEKEAVKQALRPTQNQETASGPDRRSSI